MEYFASPFASEGFPRDRDTTPRTPGFCRARFLEKSAELLESQSTSGLLGLTTFCYDSTKVPVRKCRRRKVFCTSCRVPPLHPRFHAGRLLTRHFRDVSSSCLWLQRPKPTLRRGYKGQAMRIFCRTCSAYRMYMGVRQNPLSPSSTERAIARSDARCRPDAYPGADHVYAAGILAQAHVI